MKKKYQTHITFITLIILIKHIQNFHKKSNIKYKNTLNNWIINHKLHNFTKSNKYW